MLETLRKLMLAWLLLLASGCGINSPNFMLDPGLDGCVTVKVEKLSVTGMFEAQGVNYHRLNDKCDNASPHAP